MSTGSGPSPTFASFYDFYDGPEARQAELDFYRAITADVAGPVLELGCGTGTTTLHLARAGLRVTGLDISAEMLEVARTKLEREPAKVQSRVRLVQADMKDFRLDGAFATVLLPNNCFGYLSSMQDRQNCLRTIDAHLLPQGRLVVSERHYTPDALVAMQQRGAAITVQAAGTNAATGKHTMFCWVTTYVDIVTHTIYARRYIDELQADGSVRRIIPSDGGKVRLHYFDLYELQLLLEIAGYRLECAYGSFDRAPIGPHSRSMIITARKEAEMEREGGLSA